MLTFTGLTTEEEYLPDTLTWYCLSECKFKREATVQLRGANISNFQSGLVSLWPSFFLHSQSLHLCLTVSFPLPGPARTSLSFILILFHASSFSCSVLIHHHPHPAHTHTHTHTHTHPPQPLPVSSLARYRYSLHWAFSADTVLCDSSLHRTPFGIHHIKTSLSPSDWNASGKQWLQSAIFYLITMSCPFVSALNKNLWQLITKGYAILRCMQWCLMWQWLICWIYYYLNWITSQDMALNHD